MKRLFFLLLTCCAIHLHAQTVLTDSIRSDGIWRTFMIYRPANYVPGVARPLILNLHGLGSNSAEQVAYSYFMPIADTAGFLMVYPQGLTAQGQAYWNVGMPQTPNTDDVKFLSALIDTISARYAIDAQRVYATGMSMGGFMSHYLGIHLNHKIAAIASVTGSIYPGVYQTAHPGRAVPMMQIHGTSDAVVPFNGNTTGIHIDTLVQFWVTHNQCQPVPVHTQLPDINTGDNSTADRYVYSGGRNGATCEFYKVTGGGHTWPGSPFTIGITNQDFSASAEIWRFFRLFRLGQFLSVPDAPAPSQALSISPNPCTGRIRIHSSGDGRTTIKDMAGRQVGSSTVKDIDVSALPAGLYEVRFVSGERCSSTKLVKL